TDQETDGRGDADRLPRVVAHVVVRRARGGLGAVESVVLNLGESHLRRTQLGLDLRAQVGRSFAGLFRGLLEQRFCLREHVGESLDERVATASYACGAHGFLPWGMGGGGAG